MASAFCCVSSILPDFNHVSWISEPLEFADIYQSFIMHSGSVWYAISRDLIVLYGHLCEWGIVPPCQRLIINVGLLIRQSLIRYEVDFSENAIGWELASSTLLMK